MGYVIEWSDEASVTITDILEYLEGRWSQREVNNFIFRVEEVLGLIGNNLLLYPKSNRKGVHKAVISY